MERKEQLTLEPYTYDRCVAFWHDYVADPDMMDGSFQFEEAWVKRYWENKTAEPHRRYFAVCLGDTVIGEVQLKRIDFDKGCATMSIHLSNDTYKNQGYGTEAERRIITYAFHELGLSVVYADCVHRNRRSRHVLEKVGFRFTHQDEQLHYFVLEKDAWQREHDSENNR